MDFFIFILINDESIFELNLIFLLYQCSSTLSTTYSSGTPGKDGNILTCDQDTYYLKSLNNGELPPKESLCTRSHTGTSASAPIGNFFILKNYSQI